MSTPALWLTIGGAGAVTFVLRLSLILLLGHIEIPPFLERALRYVPVAVLTAVVIPLLFYANGSLELRSAMSGWWPGWSLP
jgi:branched-subunit amino acid transport protein